MKYVYALLVLLFTTSIVAAQEMIPDKAEEVHPVWIGEKIPEAHLLDKNGATITLSNVLKQKPSVIVMYRGGWCPYCNAQLSNLYDIEDKVDQLGFQLIAISPEYYENLKNAENYGKLNYQLYSDSDGQFSIDLGIAFKTSTKSANYINSKSRLGTPSEVLPVPSVFIVDKKGTILFEYINPNYKQRISSEMLLGVLKALAK